MHVQGDVPQTWGFEMVELNQAFEALLVQMAAFEEAYFPDPEDRTPGWYSNFQVRCSDCGRFAVYLNGGDGYNPMTGDYDPWSEVRCKKHGVTSGVYPET
jgi:hypothetical protein